MQTSSITHTTLIKQSENQPSQCPLHSIDQKTALVACTFFAAGVCAFTGIRSCATILSFVGIAMLISENTDSFAQEELLPLKTSAYRPLVMHSSFKRLEPHPNALPYIQVAVVNSPLATRQEVDTPTSQDRIPVGKRVPFPHFRPWS